MYLYRLKNGTTDTPKATYVSELNLPCHYYNCYEQVSTNWHTMVDMHMPIGAQSRDFTNEKAYKDLIIIVSGWPQSTIFINSLSSNPKSGEKYLNEIIYSRYHAC